MHQGEIEMSLKDDSLVLIIVLSIAAVAVLAAFFGGFIFGGKGQNIVFSRDTSGRIESIIRM